MESHLYQELTQSEQEKVIAAALSTTILRSRLLTGGLFNTTYLVETADFGKVVLRVGPINTHLLLPFERNLMEAECHIYDLFKKEGIPASEVLAQDCSKTVISRDYMIVRYIPAGAMSETVLEEEDRARICRDIGVAAAKMHRITAARFGRSADVKAGRGFTKWSEYLLDELKQWESVARPVQLLPEELYDRIFSLVKKAAPALDQITVPHLVHTDFWTGNVLISTRSGRPEFAAVIDADKAVWGEPELEFSNIGWALRAPTFWEGYGNTLSQETAAQIRRAVYKLIWNLLDYYIFTVELTAPEDAAQIRDVALKQMELLENMV